MPERSTSGFRPSFQGQRGVPSLYNHAHQGKDLVRLGWQPGPVFRKALALADAAMDGGMQKVEVLGTLGRLVGDPSAFVDDPRWGELARELTVVEEPLPSHLRQPRSLRGVGRGADRGGRAEADADGVPSAGGSGGRADAGWSSGLRVADRRCAGDRWCGDPVWGGRGYRLPHEAVGTWIVREPRGLPAGSDELLPRPRVGDALRRGRGVPRPAGARR
jgi:hypothetical protein